jgi:hypothetical protein
MRAPVSSERGGLSRMVAPSRRTTSAEEGALGFVVTAPSSRVNILLEHIQSLSLSNETLCVIRRQGPAIEVRSDDGIQALRDLAERLAARVPPSVSVTLEAA